MKKVLCIFSVLCLFLSQITVKAAENTDNTSTTLQISEIDYFLSLKKCTDEELSANGLTESQIRYIREFNLVQAIKERGNLSESNLKELGYNNKEIAILKNICKKRNITEEEISKEFRGATLTLTLNKPTTSKSRYTYNFSFSWSSCPIFIQSDLLAATWSATGSNGSPVNVAINKSLSKLTTNYKTTGGYPNMGSVSYKWGITHEYRAASIKFDMGHNVGNGMSYWTQSGSGRLVLDAVVSNTIYEVYLKFGYGHSIVTGTPSVSFSGSGPSIGMTFGWTTQNEKTYSVRYRYDGKKVS